MKIIAIKKGGGKSINQIPYTKGDEIRFTDYSGLLSRIVNNMSPKPKHRFTDSNSALKAHSIAMLCSLPIKT